MPRVIVPWTDIRDWSPEQVASEAPLMFAFGSNINPGQLMRRAPGCRFVSVSRINFARVRFYGAGRKNGGVATLRPSTSHEAWAPGILVAMTAACVREMDLAEGHPTGYARHLVTVTGPNRQPVRAMTYLKLSNDPAGPSPEYVARIRAGYRFFGLNEYVLDVAVQRAPAFVRRLEGPETAQNRPARGHGGIPAVREYDPATDGTYRAPQGRPRSTPRPAGGRLGGADYLARERQQDATLEDLNWSANSGVDDEDLRRWIDRKFPDRDPGPDGI